MHLAARGGGSGQGIHQQRLDAAIEIPAFGGFGDKRRNAWRADIWNAIFVYTTSPPERAALALRS